MWFLTQGSQSYLRSKALVMQCLLKVCFAVVLDFFSKSGKLVRKFLCAGSYIMTITDLSEGQMSTNFRDVNTWENAHLRADEAP